MIPVIIGSSAGLLISIITGVWVLGNRFSKVETTNATTNNMISQHIIEDAEFRVEIRHNINGLRDEIRDVATTARIERQRVRGNDN